MAGIRKVKVIETGVIYNTMQECAEAIGGTSSGISKTIHGHQDTHMGFSFVWAGRSDKE